MLYLATASGPAVRAAMDAGLIGSVHTQNGGAGRAHHDGAWMADNGCFADNFDLTRWWAWLSAQDPTGCLFATAPDVVCDHQRTYLRADPWLERIRALGFPVAFVAQNGANLGNLPWSRFDVLFLGGDTTWKLGPRARALVAEAKRRGKWVHMGRVNSQRRYSYARHIGCDSADGTYLAFGPDTNLPDVLSWVRSANQLTFDTEAS